MKTALIPRNGLFLLSLVVAFASGCGGMTRQIARNATPAAVDSGLQAATTDQNQERLVDAIEPERVEEATVRLTSGATDGLVTALGNEERQERLAEAVGPMVASMVDTAINQALSDENLERVRALAKEATLGFQDAIDEVEAQKETGEIPEDEGNVLETMNDVADHSDTILYALGAAAALLFLVLVGVTVWAVRKRKKYETEARMRDQALDEISRLLSDDDRAGQDSRGNGQHPPKGEPGGDPERLRQALRRLAEQRGSPPSVSGH